MDECVRLLVCFAHWASAGDGKCQNRLVALANRNIEISNARVPLTSHQPASQPMINTYAIVYGFTLSATFIVQDQEMHL